MEAPIGVDHASGYVHFNHQLSLQTADTVRSKQLWERQAYTHGVKI